MRELETSDRKTIDSEIEIVPYKTFYHYFPYMQANQALTDGKRVYADEKTLYFSTKDTKLGVLVAPYLIDWRSSLYDTNYIYKLEETIAIKNFRANIKKFDKVNSFELHKATQGDAYKILLDWYKKKKTDDYGYVKWFVENLDLYKDIHADIGYINANPVAFSVWGELWTDTSVHIISKDRGIPYLQDKMRMEIYNDMIDRGFVYCNDGGDAGVHTLRMYKLKLRPRYIIPIWSWKGI